MRLSSEDSASNSLIAYSLSNAGLQAFFTVVATSFGGLVWSRFASWGRARGFFRRGAFCPTKTLGVALLTYVSCAIAALGPGSIAAIERAADVSLGGELS